jgi:hypothetical protein
MIKINIILLLLFIYSNCVSSFNIVLNIGSTGLLLPYSIGIISYIKTNKNFKNYELIGTSGGAYCSLLYHFEKNLTSHDYIWENIFKLNKNTKIDLHNLNLFQENNNKNLLNRYNNYDHKSVPIKIVATKYNNILSKEKVIFEKYDSIGDLITKCYCSSYIPYISGNNLYYLYNNIKYYDGAFIKNSEKNIKYVENDVVINKLDSKKKLDINCNTWGRKWSLGTRGFIDIDKSRELFEYGWKDTEKYLDKIL